MKDFWKGASIVLNLFGFLSLVMLLILFAETNTYLDSPYWAVHAASTFILFFISIFSLVLAANLRRLSVPEKLLEKLKSEGVKIEE